MKMFLPRYEPHANLANDIEVNMSFLVTSNVSVEVHELSFSFNKAY